MAHLLFTNMIYMNMIFNLHPCIIYFVMIYFLNDLLLDILNAFFLQKNHIYFHIKMHAQEPFWTVPVLQLFFQEPFRNRSK